MTTLALTLSRHLTAIFFLDKPGLAGYTRAKDDGCGGDNWSYKTCKTTYFMLICRLISVFFSILTFQRSH